MDETEATAAKLGFIPKNDYIEHQAAQMGFISVNDPRIQAFKSLQSRMAPGQTVDSLRQQLKNTDLSAPSALNPVMIGKNLLVGLGEAGNNIAANISRLTKTMPGSGLNAYDKAPLDLKGGDPQSYSQMMGIPNTLGNRLEQGVAEAAPNLLVPEAGAESWLVNALSRISGQTGISALSGKDPSQSAKISGILQTGAELIPGSARLIGSGLGKLAEKIIPQQFSDAIKNNLISSYQSSKNTASNLYNSVINKYGSNKVTSNPENYFNFSPSETRRFTPNITKSYQDFKDEPSLYNAHKFQSQIFNDANELANNSSKQNTRQSLFDAREKVKNNISSYLAPDQEALNNYLTATNITRDTVKPYESNDTLYKIVNGKKKNIDPDDLSKALQNTVENNNSKVIDNHYISQANDLLSDKIHSSDLTGQLGSGAAGLFLGGGNPFAAILAAALGKPAARIIQSPKLQSALGNALNVANSPYAHAAKNAIISNASNGNGQ